MAIEAATLTDTSELTALVNSAYRGESAKAGWTNESHLLDGQRIDELTMLSYLHDSGVTMLKYTDEESVIKACVYLEVKGDKLYLGMLTVSPWEQGNGIGKKLLAAAENHAQKLWCKAITITVITSRHELIAWYERHGYHKTGEIRPFPTDEKFGIAKQVIELLVMEKPVN